MPCEKGNAKPGIGRTTLKLKRRFRNALPHGLPSKRAIDHEILVQPGMKPSNRPLYQLSTAELVGVMEYLPEVLKAGKIG